MITLTHVSEALRMFRRHLKVKSRGYDRHPGNADDICKKIIEDCWNGSYFQTSNGHFNEFYCRDLGWCTDALLALGHRKRLEKSLRYALKKFKQQGEITVAITPKGKPFNFPDVYSIDSVAYFFRSVKQVCPKLFDEERTFFNRQIKILFNRAINKKTGLVKEGHFSAMKDYAVRDSSCYDNTMVAMLADILKTTKLDNPLEQYDYRKLIKKHFWTGKYFINDLSGSRHLTGDSNIYPFWFNLFDKGMIKSAIESMQKQNLDKPMPLKYVSRAAKGHRMIWVEMFVKHWEQDQVWPQMGFVYIDILSRIDKKKAKFHLDQYRKQIESKHNFIELYNANLEPYTTLWYSCDENLLWASMYLHMRKKLK